MLKNKKLKNVIHVFTFLLVFFICGNVDAANPVKCVYKNSNGSAQVEFEIKTDGSITKAHYVKWSGYERDKKESIGNYKEDYWDLWIFENKQCPPKVLASYEIVEWGTDHTATVHLLTSNSTTWYADSVDNWVKSNQTHLTLDTNASTLNFGSIKSTRKVSTLYATWGKNDTSYNSTNANATGKTGDQSGTTMVVNEKSILYIKGHSKTFTEDNVKDFGTDLTCTSSDTDLLTVGSKQYISMTSGDHKNLITPGYYFKVTANKPTGSDVKLKCTYKENGTVIDEFTWNIKITGTVSTTDTYSEADIKCEYLLKYTDGDGNTHKVSSAYIYTSKYNDNKGIVSGTNSMGTLFYYKNTGNQWKDVEKGTKIEYYEFSTSSVNSGKKLKYDFTKDEYETQLKNNHGSCPSLYIKKSGSTYLIQLTKSSGSTGADNTKRTSYDSSGKENSQTFDPSKNEAYSIPFTMYNASCGSTGTYNIKFTMNGSNLQYVIVKDGSEQTTKKTVTSFTADLTTDTIGSGSYTGYSYLYHKVKVTKGLLTKIKNHLTNGSDVGTVKKLTDDVSSYDYSGNMTTYRYYTLSDTTIVATGTAMDASNCEQTDGSGIEGTEEDDGTQNPSGGSGPSGLGGLNIGSSGSKQTPAEFCTSLLGDPGSRNGVGKIVESILTLIRIGVPILLIITSMVDFTKATGKDDEMVKAKKNAITRFIVAVAVLFAPSLVNLVLGLLGWDSCAIF